MLRVESNTDIRGFTEFEEDILFDEDDPDFDHKVPAITVPFLFRGRYFRNFLLFFFRSHFFIHHNINALNFLIPHNLNKTPVCFS